MVARHSGQSVPTGRLGLAEELANAIVFIASDEASSITGRPTPRPSSGQSASLSWTYLAFRSAAWSPQELALAEPELVRRLILLSTGPRGGKGMASLTPEAQKIFGARYDEPDHLWLKVFFTQSKVSQAAGRAYLTVSACVSVVAIPGQRQGCTGAA